MHNLFRLSSWASTEGFFHKPRADRELLKRDPFRSRSLPRADVANI